MKFISLGQSDLTVSTVALGTYSLTGAYGMVGREQAITAVRAAVNSGITFFDTADIYGNGLAEELLAAVLPRNSRNRVVVATKVGGLRRDRGIRIDGSPSHLRRAVEASLRRLQRDALDLCYLHRVDAAVPIEESVGALAELRQQGKIRYIGLCEASFETVRRANAVHVLTALQSEYSLWSRDVEGILPGLASLRIGFVGYSPLGRGFLAGRVKRPADLAAEDSRAFLPRFQGERLERNAQLLQKIECLADRIGVSTARLALAWVLSQRPERVALMGSANPEHIADNASAADLCLSGDLINELRGLLPPEAVAGDRYGPAAMERIDGGKSHA
jgi:aryl-alcohol dehydrogenase-like predicted oxidoreductase